MNPQHHDQPMYRDEHQGQDMGRWLCTEPRCPAVISDATLELLAESDWAREQGMVHPQEIIWRSP